MRHLRKLAFPIALLYAAGVSVRNALYNLNIIKAERFKTPVVSIGNISVGGSGKTPMIEWLVKELKDQLRIAVVSRGYKRKTAGMVVADKNSTVDTLGDEPMQIFNKFPDIHLVVDSKRARAIKYLEKEEDPNLILLDDGHQHRKVSPHLAILLTPYDDLYTENWWLPVGNLRDGVSSARRAEVIIVTKCPPSLGESEMAAIKRRLKVEESQEVLFANLVYDKMIRNDNSDISLESVRGKALTLVTGIAKPEPLVAYLKQQGLSFEHLKFRDHHNFSESEIRELNKKDFILTTSKDYTRLQGRVKEVYYLGVAHQFLGNGGAVLKEKVLALRS